MQPVQPEQPEQSEQRVQPEQRVQREQSEQSEQPEQPEQRVQPVQPEQPEQSEQLRLPPASISAACASAASCDLKETPMFPFGVLADLYFISVLLGKDAASRGGYC